MAIGGAGSAGAQSALLCDGAGTGDTEVEQERWGAPLTTFPLATPFAITDASGAPSGVGLAFHRTYLRCGDGSGSPSAVFEWTRT
jgi:hypothetical protein